MSSKELDFLISSLTEYNPTMPTATFADWFAERRQVHRFRIEQIPFKKLDKWFFVPSTGNLVHTSGKFFSVEGILVETNFGAVPQWSQPIINQPEIGILGILAKKFNGILYFLMQAKMEPGNLNMVQLSPTVQATRSNYTRVHHGSTTPYLEYFLDKSGATVLVDALQSEQGGRFLRKRNRNIIIETTRDVKVLPDYCWLTLGQIQKLVQQDNVVNMDARTVLSCIPFAAPELTGVPADALIAELRKHSRVDASLLKTPDDPFRAGVVTSVLNPCRELNDSDAIISWFTEQKIQFELSVEQIPLKFVKGWHKTETEITHDEGKFFSVVAVSVEADNREVSAWTQPLVKPQEQGILAYLVKNINGVLHFLVQAKVEPGNLDIAEIAPTVQCVTGDYRQARPEDRPPFLDYVLNVSPERVRVSTLQSEEGGRFFREANRNMIIEVEDDFSMAIPSNYTWMTLHQLKQFIKFNNFVNVEGRCLLSCLGFM